MFVNIFFIIIYNIYYTIKKPGLQPGLYLSYLHYYSIILLTVNIGPQFLAAVTQIPFLEVDA